MCYAFAGSGKRWESLRKSKKYPNLARWFNSIVEEHGTALNEVTSVYAGKKGLGEPTAFYKIINYDYEKHVVCWHQYNKEITSKCNRKHGFLFHRQVD